MTGFIAAWFYNFIARHFGGLEVELEPAPETSYLHRKAESGFMRR